MSAACHDMRHQGADFLHTAALMQAPTNQGCIFSPGRQIKYSKIHIFDSHCYKGLVNSGMLLGPCEANWGPIFSSGRWTPHRRDGNPKCVSGVANAEALSCRGPATPHGDRSSRRGGGGGAATSWCWCRTRRSCRGCLRQTYRHGRSSRCGVFRKSCSLSPSQCGAGARRDVVCWGCPRRTSRRGRRSRCGIQHKERF